MSIKVLKNEIENVDSLICNIDPNKLKKDSIVLIKLKELIIHSEIVIDLVEQENKKELTIPNTTNAKIINSKNKIAVT